MEEIIFKFNVPEESEERFRLALAKLIKELSDKAKMEELQNDDDEIKELSIMLGRKVNKSLHERYKKLFHELK